MNITAFDLASRYIGIRELPEKGMDHPLIQWWLSLCGFSTHTPDEVAWCSAFLQEPFRLLGLPRSKSAAARSWLTIGRVITIEQAKVGFDVVILKRGAGPQPGPEVIQAPGHVGLYAGPGNLLAGNQGNMVSVAPFDPSRVLGVRRLLET